MKFCKSFGFLNLGIIFPVAIMGQEKYSSYHTVSGNPEHLALLLLGFKFLLQAIRKTYKNRSNIS